MRLNNFLGLVVGLGAGFYFGSAQQDLPEQLNRMAVSESHGKSQQAAPAKVSKPLAQKSAKTANDKIQSKVSAGRVNQRLSTRTQPERRNALVGSRPVVAISMLNSEQKQFLDNLPYQVVEHYSREKAKDIAARMAEWERRMHDREGKLRAQKLLSKYFERSPSSQTLVSQHFLQLGGRSYKLKLRYSYDANIPESKASLQIDTPDDNIQNRLYYADIRATQLVDGRVFFTLPINLISDASAFRYALIEVPEFDYSDNAEIRFLDVNSNSWMEERLTWVEARLN